MSNSMFRLRRSRSSASNSQQNSTTFLGDLLIPTGRSSSSSRTTSTVEPTDRTRILLDRLKALNSDNIVPANEHRQMLDDIYNMIDSAWTLANLELKDIDKRIVQKDGVLVGTFILSMTDMLQQTVEYIENNVTCPSSWRSLQSKQKAITKDLEMLRNEVEKVYYFAMPCAPPSTRAGRTEDALAIASSISSALSVLCDSVPVLGMLKPIAAGFNEICTIIQTLRSNKQLIANILRDVREYFRMVVRKVQKSPTAQENEELRRDVQGLFQNLHDVQKTLLKLRKRHGLRVLPFTKRNSDDLEGLQRRVRHARSAFEAGLAISTNITTLETHLAVRMIAVGMDNMRVQMTALTSLNQEPPRSESSESPQTLDAAAEHQFILEEDASSSPRKQWVSVEIDVDRASHKHGTAVSLVPYMGVYFFF